jgi:predicted nucleotidyltransferase
MNNETQDQPITLSESTGKKLKEIGVAVVYFFGSRVTGDNLDFSDIDIGIVFEDIKLLEDNNKKIYLDIYDVLTIDIPDMINGPKIDISFLQKANPALAMKAMQEGKILFESNATVRADFEELTFRLYNDYKKLQYEYEDANLRAFEES